MSIRHQVRKMADTLRGIPGIQVLVAAPTEIQPAFIRYPRQGERCPVTTLPLGTVREIINGSGGQVKVRTIRRPGSTRGISIIDVQSYIAYLDSLPLASESKSSDS